MSARGFPEKHCTEQDVRRYMGSDSGYDADVWKRAAQELGLHGLTVPEQFDGSGASTSPAYAESLGVRPRATHEVATKRCCHCSITAGSTPRSRTQPWMPPG